MSAPVAVVCIGMAGSGKTTFMQRINSYLHTQNEPPYVINLDPAVRNVPFESNIDIRDSIDYKEVMSQYNLGPNGGILTSLNLFATKVDQILDILERRCGLKSLSRSRDNLEDPAEVQAKPIKQILVDTPGQIEVFVWSASGQILLSSLASSFPTVIAYIIDTPRTTSTSTFMSNMLYACSILYKTKLPMILVFNKSDVQSADFAKEWMTDFEAFQAALKKEEDTGTFGGAENDHGGIAVGGSGYMSSLLNSMSLVLEEFYKHLSVVAFSSYTGAGVQEFFESLRQKTLEFENEYKPELERRRSEREKEKAIQREQDLGKLMEDLNMQPGRRGSQKDAQRKQAEPETISDLEDEADEGDEASLVDPDEAEQNADRDNDLNSRYREATASIQNNGPPHISTEDLSFARYVRSSNFSA